MLTQVYSVKISTYDLNPFHTMISVEIKGFDNRV